MKIATLNTRGFNSTSKHTFLLDFIKKHDIDIIALQEINSPVTNLQDSEYEIFSNAPAKLGTALLFKRHLKPRTIQQSAEGRIIRAEFENFTVVNVYGYANANAEVKRDFYQTILPMFLRPYHENLILLGDFNATLDKKNNKSNNKALTELVNGMNLYNASTLIPCTQNVYTFRSKAGQSFIDHILVEGRNREMVSAFEILPYAASDHEMVVINFGLTITQTKTQKKKTAYWKLNVSLLEDPDFKNVFTQFYDSCRRRKCLYNSTIDWWEQDFKRIFKQVCSQFSKEKRADFKNRIYFKEKCLTDLAEKLNKGEDKIAEYVGMKKTVEELKKEEFKGRGVRGRLHHPIEEEGVGAAHLIQERRTGEERTIEKLSSDSGEILTSEGQMANFIFDYFSRLYKLEVKKSADFETKISSYPAQGLASPPDNSTAERSSPGQAAFLSCIENKLSVGQGRDLEAALTADEILNVISGLKKSKSPGMDGIPNEFYQVFAPLLITDLTELFQCIIASGRLSVSQRTSLITHPQGW